MDRYEKGTPGRGGTKKKKVTEAIGKLEKHRAELTRYLSRSGCHPCDRSEAGHQLSMLNKEINNLTDLLKHYGSCYVSE